MKETVNGWFVYESRNDGWADRFVVEDDDGMAFALDSLKRFHGRPVRITIEETPDVKPDLGPTAYVYERIGMTAKNVRAGRDAERERMLADPPR